MGWSKRQLPQLEAEASVEYLKVLLMAARCRLQKVPDFLPKRPECCTLKKSKTDNENRQFNSEWIEKYVCGPFGPIACVSIL